MRLTPNHKLLLVTSGQDGRPEDLNNDYLTVIDVQNGRFTILGHVQLAGEPVDPSIAISADSQLAYVVTQRRSAQPALYEIQLTAPIQVTRRLPFPDGSPSGVAISSKHKRIFVSDFL